MALILCIETGTDICSVALARDGKVISIEESSEGRDHASKLSIFIDDILRGTQTEASDLDAVAVSKGPGSYTGLRIGVSTAKALCYALKIPLIGIGSLDSMTAVAIEDIEAGIIDVENPETATFCPMIDARRMEVYTQMFDHNIKELSPTQAHIVTPESFTEELSKEGKLIIFGNGAEKCLDVIKNDNLQYIQIAPSARGLAQLAQTAYDQLQFVDTAYFEPLYLKDFMIHKSKKKFF